MATVIPSRPVSDGARTNSWGQLRCSGHEDLSRRYRLSGVELMISQGRASQLVRKVHGPVFLIGASCECDLVLGDASFPPVHSYLFLTEQGVRLRHLGAAPQVRVNGRLIEVAMLTTGDYVDLDPFQFQIRIHE